MRTDAVGPLVHISLIAQACEIGRGGRRHDSRPGDGGMLRHPRLSEEGDRYLPGRAVFERTCNPRVESSDTLKGVLSSEEDCFLMDKAFEEQSGREEERGREKRMTQLRAKRHFDCVLHFGDLVGELPPSTICESTNTRWKCHGDEK